MLTIKNAHCIFLRTLYAYKSIQLVYSFALNTNTVNKLTHVFPQLVFQFTIYFSIFPVTIYKLLFNNLMYLIY